MKVEEGEVAVEGLEDEDEIVVEMNGVEGEEIRVEERILEVEELEEESVKLEMKGRETSSPIRRLDNEVEKNSQPCLTTACLCSRQREQRRRRRGRLSPLGRRK